MWVCWCESGIIQFSNLQTELKYLDSFKFYYVLTDLGVPPLGWVGGCIWVGWEWREVSHACAHAHACTCYDIIGISQGFPNAIAINYLVYTCMHVHAHVHTCNTPLLISTNP